MLGDSARRGLSRAIAAFTVAVFVAGCGGGGPDDELSRTLLKRLPASDSVEGFVEQRTFDWGDPVNLIGEGLHLPEATRPSDAVAAFHDAGIVAGAGKRLSQGLAPNVNYVTIGVIKLGSADKAKKLQRWIHRQDLQPPCFDDCLYSPKDLPVPGVPHVTAVQQVPGSPADFGPPVHFLAEFVVGPYLYFASSDGSPEDASDVVAGLQDFYKTVRKHRE